VKKGEKSSLIVFWDRAKEKDDNGRETGDSYFFLKYYSVFNVAQAAWDDLGKAKIAAMEEELGKKHRERIHAAEEIIEKWMDKPTIRHDKSGRASYSRVIDRIRLPEIGYFETSDEYYATLFHECIHATGHKNRLNRFDEYKEFDEDMMHNYSKEELVAELGASYLAAVANLDHDYRNSAAYIKGWSKRLKENTNWLMWAAKRAQKAADLILGITSQPKGKEAAYVS
jgi:antirestriction protein ArdC